MRNFCSALVGAVIFSAPALAADMPVKAQPIAPVYSWTGFYVGGHAGYAWTTQRMSATDRAAITATYGAVPSPKGFVGGLHAGYDYQLANRVVVGIGLEVNGFGVDAVNNTTGIAPGSSLKSTVDWDFTVFGRVGYTFDGFLPYVLFGGAWDHNKVNGFNGFIGPLSVNVWHTGWTAGVVVEMPTASHWIERVQYRFVDSDTQTYLNRQISRTGSNVDAGVSYRF
jgi:opacity protein-like surface antigen